MEKEQAFELSSYPLPLNFKEGEGVLLVDKPLTWTSFDVVKKLRYALGIKKVGHAGTLDPLATGLLIVCFGKFTKQIDSFMAARKVYSGTIFLGATTPSFDAETNPENFQPTKGITLQSINEVLPRFSGEIQQFPPMHSAINVNGQRLYELARKGESIELKPRSVEVFDIEISNLRSTEEHAGLLIDFMITTSKGFYVRSFANDLGAALGCGGYLTALRREASGEHSVRYALSPIQWVEIIRQQKVSL